MGKPEVRKEILGRLKTQDPRLKIEKDKKIREKFLTLPEFKEAKTVAFYVSFGSEVDTGALIDEALKQGKGVVVPVVSGDDLMMYGIKDRRKDLISKGPYGIFEPDIRDIEPFPSRKIDLIAVPGVAFARSGARLGRGKGYYDRFLQSLPGRTKKIGLAYDLQIADDLPVATHDVPVDLVVTN